MATTIDPRTRLEVLDREECLAMLGHQSLGRLAVVGAENRPYVFPVMYTLDGTAIVFRTDRGTKLHLADGHWVAFECDGVDATYHTGWSVVVSGVAEEISNASEIVRLSKLPLGVWLPGDAPRWVRIRPMSISGRRIPPHGSTGAAC
jgi:nitroimidazol reductase NimA-like FMN-containing flavoprotein (pyridoxamine 5'-phosphate oxidase superfamily)